jgi:hypothetical protein
MIFTQKDIKVSLIYNFFWLILEINKTNTYFYIFAFVETFVLIGVSIWQSYYMRHLFEVKGSL